jgi:polyhydroxybutyrate depolymerase
MTQSNRHRPAARRDALGALFALLVAVSVGCDSADLAETDASGTAVVVGGSDAGRATPDAAPLQDAGSPPAAPGGSKPLVDAAAAPQDSAAAQDSAAPRDAAAVPGDAGTEAGSPPQRDAATDAAIDPSTASCTGTLRAGDSTRNVNVDGMMRSYLLHVPANYDGQRRVPLLVDLHPIGSNGASHKRTSGYVALSDSDGFLVAHPNGIDNAWNVGPCCTKSRSVDDVAFIRALVKDLEGAACVDSKRVYAAGFSMGGGMAHFLGCHAADVFAAIAPAAFDLLQENVVDCRPARSIPVLASRGTADPIVPYQGGASMPPNGLNVTIHFLGAVETFKKWSELDRCTGAAETAEGGCQFYRTCANGAEVGLCTASGGGHATGNAQRGWAFLKRFSL